MLKEKLDLCIGKCDESTKFATFSTQLPIHIQKIITNKGGKDPRQETD